MDSGTTAVINYLGIVFLSRRISSIYFHLASRATNGSRSGSSEREEQVLIGCIHALGRGKTPPIEWENDDIPYLVEEFLWIAWRSEKVLQHVGWPRDTLVDQNQQQKSVQNKDDRADKPTSLFFRCRADLSGQNVHQLIEWSGQNHDDRIEADGGRRIEWFRGEW